MQMTSGQRIFGLDLMRASAIMLVVLSHISWLLPNKSGLIFDLMSIAGVIGVEIFFVLSGFLIGRIIYRFFLSESFNFSKVSYFWIRRWFRTLPNYFLALILNIIVVLSMGFALPDGIWKYVFFIQNFGWEMPPFFYESWSLSIEEFAYLIGPIIVYLFYRFKPAGNRSRQFLLMTISIIVLCTLLRFIYNLNDGTETMAHWNLNLKAVVIYRLDAVYYGALAAYLSLVRPNVWIQMRFPGFVIGVIIFVALNIIPVANQIFIETHSAFWNIWYLPLNSIAIMLTLPWLSGWKARTNIIVRLITGVSLISYAMYVLHYSIIMQVMRHQIPNESFVGFDLYVFISVYLALVFVCSYVLYKFFERPLTNLRDHPKVTSYFK